MQLQRARLLQLLVVVAIFGAVVVYVYQGFFHDAVFLPASLKKVDDHEIHRPESEFYEWRTVTSFPSLTDSYINRASIDELCKHFPKHRLQDIQPVLKTGHATLDRVRNSLNSTSACLDQLLIFSDLDEDLDGHHLIDVIADIPQHLLQSEFGLEQTAAYRELHHLVTTGEINDPTAVSHVKGWEIDKFKFFTTISRAWRMAPERRWYVFYEGDTYVVWDTVFRLLEHFDADVPHYFGSPSPRRENEWFANGGPGYILSRAAMRKLVARDYSESVGDWLAPDLVERYWTETLLDCCGDSLVGLALVENDVMLKGLWPSFNPHPLQGIPFADLYWCQPVLSLHKSDFALELDLWRFEWKARSRDSTRPLLYRDIAIDFFNFTSSSFAQRRTNWDNADWDGFEPPFDSERDPHASAEACDAACAEFGGCFQWTYHVKRCTFVRSFRFGVPKEPSAEVQDEGQEQALSLKDRTFVAGWDLKKIQPWIQSRPCEQVQWVRPSTTRIF